MRTNKYARFDGSCISLLFIIDRKFRHTFWQSGGVVELLRIVFPRSARSEVSLNAAGDLWPRFVKRICIHARTRYKLFPVIMLLSKCCSNDRGKARQGKNPQIRILDSCSSRWWSAVNRSNHVLFVSTSTVLKIIGYISRVTCFEKLVSLILSIKMNNQY